jgi:hypothetical protein
MAYDDEGGYLYAAWRIGAGELPYRDFLTPKLPVFLYPGALVLRLTDNSVFALRSLGVALTLASVALVYLTLRRLWGNRVALLAVILCLIQRDVFWAARFFRPEASMLFWDALGIYLFVRAEQRSPSYRHRPWGLVASGLAFALGTLANLFGLLPLLGCFLLVVIRAGKGRSWLEGMQKALWIGMPCVLLGGLVVGLFLVLAPDFLNAVLGHHLRQGRQLVWWQVALKGLKLYWNYCRAQPVLVLLALVGALRSWRVRPRLALLFVCQLPTALAFLFLSRDLQARHLVYLVPSLAALAATGLELIWGAACRSRGAVAWRSALVTLLMGAALFPSWRSNRAVASLRESDTERLAIYIQDHTDAEDYVLCDYPGLNFFARRRTTPLAAGISRGAAKSGQIKGDSLIREMDAYDVQMVLLNVAQGAHQLSNLRDYAHFKHYVQTGFHLAGRTVYDYRLLELYHRQDLWRGDILDANFGDRLLLSGIMWKTAEASPGRDLRAEMRWQSIQPMQSDYFVSLTLHDEDGHLWGLGSKQLNDVDTQTFWDERGLEQAVLIPTSQWPESETTVGAFELPVTLATPPGEYSALVRVHPMAVWEGLPVRSPGGAASGFDYPIGKVQVLPASEPPSTADLEITHPHEEDLGDALRLLGWDISTTDARPGDMLLLSLFWEALRPMRADYEARLRLTDEQGRPGGEVSSPPAGVLYPTSQWQVGEVLRGQHDLTVDASARSGVYSLELNLFDESDRRILMRDLSLGTVTVSGRERVFELSGPIQHPMHIDLGERIRLLGYDLPRRDVSHGDGVSLTLYWQALRRMDTSYTVFTHLVDGENRIWGQQDNRPVQDSYPTTGWLPGEVIPDEYRISVDAQAPLGRYWLEVGLYDAATGIRLSAVDHADKVLLGEQVLLDETVVIEERE